MVEINRNSLNFDPLIWLQDKNKKLCHPTPFIPKGTPARGEISPLGARGEQGKFAFSEIFSGIQFINTK